MISGTLPPTHIAILIGDKEGLVGVKEALDNGSPVDEIDDVGRTALWFACKHGENDICQLLLDRGADVRLKSMELGIPPILCACGSKWQHTECMHLLLKASAEPNSSDIKGWTPLMYAAMSGNVETIKMLLKAGADRTATVQQGLIETPHTAAQLARLAGRPEVAAFLEKPSLEPQGAAAA